MNVRLLLPALLVTALAPLSAYQDGTEDPADVPDTSAAGATEAPVSHLVRPSYFGAEPPECRALRSIQIAFANAAQPRPRVTRTREEALERAREVVRRARAGTPFGELYAAYADGPPNKLGVLGSFPPGMLLPAMDAFLAEAAIGDASEPLESEGGYHVVQRIERWAACRYVLVRAGLEGSAERIADVERRARAGESFDAIAADFEPQEVQLFERVFERGPSDRLVKEAAFEHAPGIVFGPVPSPAGPVFGRRLPLDALPEDARESSWVRARAILIAHREVGGPIELSSRSPVEARDLARDLHARIRAGEADMAELAREYDDDATGRERAGDLGWLYRHNPRMSPALERVFLAEPGELLDPLPLSLGWLLLRRER